MRTLGIDCSTEACSVALFDGGRLIAHDHRILGRGHAEHLVPMIQGLPDKGRAGRILVALGPGSFTGIRIGIATARALALVWRAEVLGYPTLALVAAMARAEHPGQPVTVCMTGGHGEWFIQDFGEDGLPSQSLRSLTPDKASGYGTGTIFAGSKARERAAQEGPGRTVLDILPDARHVLALPEALLSPQIQPIYGRAPDARLASELAG
ncbi:tRNA (adenosine(37)-N6)-threonylcarbamoyltransferase complex dimerization subunit type 1 TsaB [Parerythrobacter aurantius]|uniref:tRNA (adenosine(37)-N6)-threonylcarbamoyltransferase complex dimerization subunit type 1 TsaB n=1 Tax=Parerythrobacter aurantius TaxID=3127706 RepID=UPI0032495203